MSAPKWRNKLTAAILLALAGCKGWFGPKDLPEDPLFLSRKPVEAKAELQPPVHVAYAEPAMPVNPLFKNPAGVPVFQKKTP